MDFELPSRLTGQLQDVPTPWGVLTGLKTDRISQTILADGQYEWAETAIVGQLLRAGATAIDVGANIGYYTALFRCLIGAKGAVHSFEANPITAQLLARTVAANDWRNVTINNVAVGDKAGLVRVAALSAADMLKDEEFNLGGWSIRPSKDGDWELPVVPLDQYVKDSAIAKVHLLKVDVEGFELKVLQGGDNLLRKLHPYVIVEMRSGNERDRVRCEKMIEQLERRDYINCRIMKRPFPHFRKLEPADTASGKYHFNMLALPAARYREFEASLRG